MSQRDYLREGRFSVRERDVEIAFRTIDGIGLPPFPSADSPGGYPQRIWDIQNLETRLDDVILATYPKSGTHWTSEILNMILRECAEYVKDSRVGTMLELVPNLEMMQRVKSPRVLSTHLPYKWFPKKHIEKGGKIIQTLRHPKDTYVSFFHHITGGHEYGPSAKHMTWSQFFDIFVVGVVTESSVPKYPIFLEVLHNHKLSEKHCSVNTDTPYGTWFDYVKEMEQGKKENENIYTLYYEALSENPEREIKALAQFLKKPVSTSLAKDIACKCSFKNLAKAHRDTIQFPVEIVQCLDQIKTIMPDFHLSNIYRKGIVGDWKNQFTVAQNETFDAVYTTEMKDSSIRMIYG